MTVSTILVFIFSSSASAAQPELWFQEPVSCSENELGHTSYTVDGGRGFEVARDPFVPPSTCRSPEVEIAAGHGASPALRRNAVRVGGSPARVSAPVRHDNRHHRRPLRRAFVTMVTAEPRHPLAGETLSHYLEVNGSPERFDPALEFGRRIHFGAAGGERGEYRQHLVDRARGW